MRALLLAAALTAAHCTEPKPAPPPPDPVDMPTCAKACARLMKLGCHDGDPTAEGASCVAVCENAADSPSPLPVACVTRAADCEAAAQCGSEP